MTKIRAFIPDKLNYTPKPSAYHPHDAGYVNGGSWKCSASPTGAHHWVGGQSPASLFRCKWCNSTRQFTKPQGTVMLPSVRNYKGKHGKIGLLAEERFAEEL